MHTQVFSSNWSFDVTQHANQRMAQRNISPSEIEFVITYGEHRHTAGAIFFHLRKKDIPLELRHYSAISRLEGTTVVTSSDTSTVITVYRNRTNGLRQVKHKKA